MEQFDLLSDRDRSGFDRLGTREETPVAAISVAPAASAPVGMLRQRLRPGAVPLWRGRPDGRPDGRHAIRHGQRHSAGGSRGDDDLNPGMGRPAIVKPAAVLVPVIERPGGATILLTQRTAHLKAHAGQICFPGGRIESDDAGPEAAALRETREEIGLPASHVEVLGRLDTYVTRTGYEVVPIVGTIRPPFTLAPDPHEVADVFEVPLAYLLDPDSVRVETREAFGAKRCFYVFEYGDRYIWGATAGMLVNLRDILAEGADPHLRT